LPNLSNQQRWKSICNNLAVFKIDFFTLKSQATHLAMVKDKIISKPNKLFEFSDDKTGRGFAL